MGNQWHYRILGEEFGPVSESTLRSLIDDGTVGPADEIRSLDSADWRRADSLDDSSVQDDAPEPDVPMDLDALLAPSEVPVEQSTKAAAVTDWFYRIDGVQSGPVDFDGLFEEVAAGRLSAADEILAPGGADWVAANSIVGLFPEPPVEEEASADSTPTAEEEIPVPVDPDQLSVDDVDDWDEDYLGDPDTEPAPPATAQSSDEFPDEEVPDDSESAHAPAASPEASPSATVAAADAVLANIDHEPAQEGKQSGRSFAMPKLSVPNLSPNLVGLLIDPKFLGVVAVALLVVGLTFVPWGAVSSPEGGDLVVQLEQAWEQVKPLVERDAADQEWDTVATQVGPQLQSIAQEATDRGAGPEVPVLEMVRTLAADQIPQVLQSKQETTRTRVQLVDSLLGRARELTE